MESMNVRGEWWPESDPHNRVAGELRYKPGELPRLKLTGDFESSFGNESDTNFKKIIGITEEGDEATIIGCARDKQSHSSVLQSGFVTSEYVGRIFLNGASFENKNPAFDKLQFGLTGLNIWGNLSEPTRSNEIEDYGNVGDGDVIGIDFEIPEQLECWLSGWRIGLRVSVNYNFEKYDRATLEHSHYFVIEPRRAQVPLSEYYKHINKLKNLVSFALSTPVTITEAKGYLQQSEERTEAEIYYAHEKPTNPNISKHPKDHLFSLHDVSFAEVVSNWYEQSSQLENSIDLYMGALFNNSMYPQNKFLGYCHAIESYHRNQYDDKYMNEADFESFYQDISKMIKYDPEEVYPTLTGKESLSDRHEVPNSLKSSLVDSTLKYSNEFSLRRRIKEVAQTYDNILRELPHNILGKEKMIADTRNYFSHYTDELEEKAATDEELQILIWGLQQTLEAAILSQIGLRDSRIKESLKSKYSGTFVQSL